MVSRAHRFLRVRIQGAVTDNRAMAKRKKKPKKPATKKSRAASVLARELARTMTPEERSASARRAALARWARRKPPEQKLERNLTLDTSVRMLIRMTKKAKSRAAAALARARNDALTPRQRSESARVAARARWAKKRTRGGAS